MDQEKKSKAEADNFSQLLPKQHTKKPKISVQTQHLADLTALLQSVLDATATNSASSDESSSPKSDRSDKSEIDGHEASHSTFFAPLPGSIDESPNSMASASTLFAQAASSDQKEHEKIDLLALGTDALATGNLDEAVTLLTSFQQNCNKSSIDNVIALTNLAHAYLLLALQSSQSPEQNIKAATQRLEVAATSFQLLPTEVKESEEMIFSQIQKFQKMIGANDFSELSLTKTDPQNIIS